MMSTAPAVSPAAQAWARLVWLLERFTILLFVALAVDVLWGVVSRYVLGHQSRWTEELAVYLLIWVSLFGAALMYRDRGHLGVDYFVGKLHPDAQRVAAVVAELAVILFAGFALVYGGGMLVAETLGSGQVTPAMGWRIGYLYSAVPLSGLFMVCFGIEHLARARPQPPASPEGGLAE